MLAESFQIKLKFKQRTHDRIQMYFKLWPQLSNIKPSSPEVEPKVSVVTTPTHLFPENYTTGKD